MTATGLSAEPLLLAGGGGFARETAAAIRAINTVELRWDVVGVLDDNPQRWGERIAGVRILGPVEAVHDHPSARVVVTMANPGAWWTRTQVVRRLGLNEERYATLVHPAAALDPGSVIGHGTVVLAGAVATADVRLGAHVVVMPAVVLTHDAIVGDAATLASGVKLGGGCAIGTGAYLGAGAMVREGCRVGAFALVGMGAVALSDVPPGQVWAGSPARRLGCAAVPADLMETALE